MTQIIACYYSFINCQILIGEVDNQGDLLISQGENFAHIPIDECSKKLISLSDFQRPIWINKHLPLKNALSVRGVSGEVDLGQEDGELKDLFLSLKHSQRIKMAENIEALGSQFSLALQILTKALMKPLSGKYAGVLLYSPDYDSESVGIDFNTELRKVIKLFEV